MSAQNDPSYNLLILPNPKICRDPVDKETDFEQKKRNRSFSSSTLALGAPLLPD